MTDVEGPGIRIVITKPPFAEAMKRAREFVLSVSGDRPTRKEVFGIYRACRAGLCIFFRCTFSNN